MKKLLWLILLLYGLLPQPVKANYGAGSIIVQPKGYFLSQFVNGDSTGFGIARDLCIKRGGGVIRLGPGCEGLTLNYPSNAGILVVREFTTGMNIDPLINQVNGGGGSITSVKTYGALGDSVTNDTNAILAAIAATPNNGVLYFPSGNYRLSTWTVQTLSKVLVIKGDGKGISRIIGTSGNSFLNCTNNIQVRDITFDTWLNVFDHSNITTVLNIVSFDNVEFLNYNKALFGSSTASGRGINSLSVTNCRFNNATQYPIFYAFQQMEFAYIYHNIINKAVQRGINLGDNVQSFAPTRGRYIIQANQVDSIYVTGSGTNTAIAIIVYGWRAEVSENMVRWVYNPDHFDATNVDGIYTKCRNADVHDNICIDAGQSEGYLNIKGLNRFDPDTTSPAGYATKVHSNILIDTGTTGRLAYGAKLATSEVDYYDNYHEGFTGAGTYTDSDASNGYWIHSNRYFAIRGSAAILVYGSGSGVRVNDNWIDSVSCSFDTTAQPSGINVQKTAGKNIEFILNRIRKIVDRGTTPVGILHKPSGVLHNERFILNNVDGATYGLQFSNTAPDSVFVTTNTFQNITTQDIKYSVTPTNLVDLPAAQPVVTYEQTDRAAIQNSLTPQILRIYGTKTDLNNYERLSLQANATSTRIVMENLGTGVARPLEIGVNTNKWRWLTGGSFEPMTDATFDIGSIGARPRQLEVVRVDADSGRFNQGAFFGGQKLTKYMQVQATALDFDLTSVVSQDINVAVPGAALQDQVAIGVPAGSVTADTIFFGWVSAVDQVTIRACRLAGTPNPASGNFKVSVFK